MISVPAVLILLLFGWVLVMKGKGSWGSLIIGIMIGATATFVDPIVNGIVNGVAAGLSGIGG